MKTLLQEVAGFAARVRSGDVEEDILIDARRRVTDILGISLAASGMETARIVEGVIQGWGGEGQSGIIGTAGRYPTATQARRGHGPVPAHSRRSVRHRARHP